MPVLVRRNYTSAYLAAIGEEGTNGRLVRRNGKLLRRSRFDVGVHSVCYMPNFIPIPTYTLGTDQYGRPTCTPGAFSLWSPFSANDVRNQVLYDGWRSYYPLGHDPRDTRFGDGILLADWELQQDFDDTDGQHDQVAWHFHFTERLVSALQPRWTPGLPTPYPDSVYPAPVSVPDWFWAAEVQGTLEFDYDYKFAGGLGDINDVPDGRFYDTERDRFAYSFGKSLHTTRRTNPNGFQGVIWSAWLYGPREQHRIRGTGLEIYGTMADFTSDLDTDPTGYASDRQFAALIDTWLRNEVAGIYLMLTTANATPWNP